MRQLYLDGLDMAPEGDSFPEGEEPQPREGAQESEVSNSTPIPIEKMEIWSRLVPYLEKRARERKNTRIILLYYRGQKGNLPSFESDEYVSFVKYIPQEGRGREEQHIFRTERRPDIEEILDQALENLKDHCPLPVSEPKKGDGFYLVQVGDLPEKKPTSHELFLRDIEERRSMGESLNVPLKKELLRKYFSKYRVGKRMDLDRPGRYNRARRTEKYFDIEREEAERERGD